MYIMHKKKEQILANVYKNDEETIKIMLYLTNIKLKIKLNR